jgi:hypothetical protein
LNNVYEGEYQMTWFERETPVVIGKGATAHELLKIIYQCPELPLTTRMRAAIASLPFEAPKLSAVYQASETDFAALLDQRIRRIEQSKLIEHHPQPPPNGTVEIKRPLAHTVDRRFRRI